MTYEDWIDPALTPQQVVFLTGAGISADGPTNGPVGLQLTSRAIEYAYWPGTVDELREAYAAIEPVPPRELPRLEAVLEIAVRAHGPTVLLDLLSDLAHAAPNALHEFFALHVNAGGGHITANFDILIDNLSQSTDVIHFHGSLDETDHYESIGATLSRIERGFPEVMRHQLSHSLLAPATRELVIVGYSGLDFFDMDPFIADIATQMAAGAKRVVWIDHNFSAAPGNLEITTKPDQRWAPMLKTLYFAGVSCLHVRARTDAILTAYAAAFGFPPVLPQSRGGSRWCSPAPLADEHRLDATRLLYLHLGMLRSLGRFMTEHPSLSAAMSGADLAEIAWQTGDHRRALARWEEFYAGPEPAMMARRLERRAACMWDRGSYIGAYLVSSRAAAVAIESGDPTTVAHCLETKARVLNHMGRTPDLHWFATRRRISSLRSQVLEALKDQNLAVHTRTRLEDAAGLLDFDPERVRATNCDEHSNAHPTLGHAEVFNQYESLSALLDYRRGNQRRERAADQLPIPEDWLRTYLRGVRFLGKAAAEKTVPALPGASPHFTLPEAAAYLAHAPATVWQRGRLLGRYLLDRRRLRRPMERARGS